MVEGGPIFPCFQAQPLDILSQHYDHVLSCFIGFTAGEMEKENRVNNHILNFSLYFSPRKLDELESGEKKMERRCLLSLSFFHSFSSLIHTQ
jgi:hypothetical protein